MTPYEYLKHEIIIGNMLPGSVVDEKEISSKLKVSRTPVREAILRLNEEGFITIVPRKGTFVSTISFKGIKDVYELRILLEPTILEEACGKYDQAELKAWRDYYQKVLNDIEATPPQKPDANHDIDKLFHMFLASPLNNSLLTKGIAKIMDKTSRIRNLSNIMIDKRKDLAYEEHIEVLNYLMKEDKEGAKSAMIKHLKHTLEAYTKL